MLWRGGQISCQSPAKHQKEAVQSNFHRTASHWQRAGGVIFRGGRHWLAGIRIKIRRASLLSQEGGIGCQGTAKQSKKHCSPTSIGLARYDKRPAPIDLKDWRHWIMKPGKTSKESAQPHLGGMASALKQEGLYCYCGGAALVADAPQNN